MGRAPCCEKVGLKKGRWASDEDQTLINYIQANGEGSWRSLPKNAGLLRCGKSCRLRWLNYLRADVKRGNISSQEEDLIIRLHASLGNRWSLIAGHLPGRTDNEIKNYWNSRLSRRIHNNNFNSPRNEVMSSMPTSFIHLSKFITTGTCRRRRGGRMSRLGTKDSKHNSRFMPPLISSPIQQQAVEMLGQVDEQSVLSWPNSEESSNKVCSSHQGSFESEFMCLDDLLASGVGEEIEDLADQGNVSVVCSNYCQSRSTDHETDDIDATRNIIIHDQYPNGVVSSPYDAIVLPDEKHCDAAAAAAASATCSAMSEEWADDWKWESSFHDQQILIDEEEMLSWLWDGTSNP